MKTKIVVRCASYRNKEWQFFRNSKHKSFTSTKKSMIIKKKPTNPSHSTMLYNDSTIEPLLNFFNVKRIFTFFYNFFKYFSAFVLLIYFGFLFHQCKSINICFMVSIGAGRMDGRTTSPYHTTNYPFNSTCTRSVTKTSSFFQDRRPFPVASEY